MIKNIIFDLGNVIINYNQDKIISNFTDDNCEINNYKYYGGKNGGKICIKYNIDNTPYISNIRKQFYKKILKLRYDEILKVNYNKLS